MLTVTLMTDAVATMEAPAIQATGASASHSSHSNVELDIDSGVALVVSGCAALMVDIDSDVLNI